MPIRIHSKLKLPLIAIYYSTFTKPQYGDKEIGWRDLSGYFRRKRLLCRASGAPRNDSAKIFSLTL